MVVERTGMGRQAGRHHRTGRFAAGTFAGEANKIDMAKGGRGADADVDRHDGAQVDQVDAGFTIESQNRRWDDKNKVGIPSRTSERKR